MGIQRANLYYDLLHMKHGLLRTKSFAALILQWLQGHPFLFFLLLCGGLLYYTSGLSPRIGYSDLSDPNMFRIIGLGIFEDKLPYRDLWDGKGFVCFLLVGLFAKVIPGIFTGQWVLGVLSVTVTMYYFYRFAKDILDCRSPFFCTVVALVPLLLKEQVLSYGGTSDEYMMPFMAVILYYSSVAIKTASLSAGKCFWIGLSAACIFWIKFTIFPTSCILIAAALLQISLKRRSVAWRELFWVCLPVVLVSAGIIGYFAYHHALDSLWYGYYVFHRDYHPVGLRLFNNLLRELKYQALPFGCVVFSLVILVRQFIKGKTLLNGALLLALIICLCFTYLGSSFYYYLLPIYPFTVVFFVYLVEGRGEGHKFLLGTMAVVTIISYSSMNFYNLHKGSLAQVKERKSEIQKIAEYCKANEDNRLICYGMMDFGVHNFMGTLPHVCHYQQCNYDEPGGIVQRGIIENRQTRYVMITRGSEAEKDIPFLEANGYYPVNEEFAPSPLYMLFVQREAGNERAPSPSAQ